jgi:hypothetical protein
MLHAMLICGISMVMLLKASHVTGSGRNLGQAPVHMRPEINFLVRNMLTEARIHDFIEPARTFPE